MAATGDVMVGTASSAELGRELETAFRLPKPGWPRAVFQSDYGYRGGRLVVDGRPVLDVPSRQPLARGVSTTLVTGERVTITLVEVEGTDALELTLDGEPAIVEQAISAKPSRSAWIHAVIALVGSFAGFAGGYIYLVKAQSLSDPWALKMAYHTAGWHLLLTFTLFPASVWGQRVGIRAVQLISLVFFCIHVGIAIANAGFPNSLHDGAIAVLNALSGLLFLASVIYGQRAWRDMDPIEALRQGRL
ncbi:MAG: hypothetical protein RIF41_03705 [Polyangiaceae bacterium]